jgi:hypothetical protein
LLGEFWVVVGVDYFLHQLFKRGADQNASFVVTAPRKMRGYFGFKHPKLYIYRHIFVLEGLKAAD